MTESEAACSAGFKRLRLIIEGANKAKTHTEWEMRKISSAKRCKKWKEINTRAIKEYHAWIESELQELKRRETKHAGKKGN